MQIPNTTEKKLIDLKEVSLSQDQMRQLLTQQQQEFRQYSVPSYFEEFKAYHHIEHEETQVEKYERLQQKKVFFVNPTRITGGEFSRPIFDRTHFHVELNQVHKVQYLPNPVTADSSDTIENKVDNLFVLN